MVHYRNTCKERIKIINPYTIEAIPTVYKNFTYRSKLEAQHAKFYDLLGIDFKYESQTFNFNTTVYTPDFKLFMPNDKIRWIEIKGPDLYHEARLKAGLLAIETNQIVQVWCGSWYSQTIYSFVNTVEYGVQIVRHKQLDAEFGYWSRRELREAYEEAYQI